MKYIQGLITGITLTLLFLLIFNANFRKRRIQCLIMMIFIMRSKKLKV